VEKQRHFYAVVFEIEKEGIISAVEDAVCSRMLKKEEFNWATRWF